MDNPRKSPRAEWMNYSEGMFFVTVCTKNRIPFFGKICAGEMCLSPIGEIIDYELSHPHLHHSEIEIPLYVVMPNHIHAIIFINIDNTPQADMARHVPTLQRNPNPSLRANAELKRHVPLLSKYMASMKSAVTKCARNFNPDFGWQARYHDHLIRNNVDGNNIANYIVNNPYNWTKDCFYN